MPRATWPPYRTVRDLIHLYKGMPALVIGGGETLAEGVRLAPPGSVLISVNDHALRYMKRGTSNPRTISWVVACDKNEKRWRNDIEKGGDGTPWGLPVISRHMWADWRLPIMPSRSSGRAGAFVARTFGCSPIILTGMDLYAGGTYHDDPMAKSSGKSISDRDHYVAWRDFVAKYPAMYRTIGCHNLLTELVGRYDPREVVQLPQWRERLAADIGGKFAKITRECMVSTRPFFPGDVFEFHPNEVEKIIRMRNGHAVPMK